MFLAYSWFIAYFIEDESRGNPTGRGVRRTRYFPYMYAKGVVMIGPQMENYV